MFLRATVQHALNQRQGRVTSIVGSGSNVIDRRKPSQVFHSNSRSQSGVDRCTDKILLKLR
jgi:hypothetical protein